MFCYAKQTPTSKSPGIGTVQKLGVLFIFRRLHMKVAILIDGGFYRKRAAHLWGKLTAQKRAEELCAYCMAHCKNKELYRIFYYDCPPLDKQVYHPFLKKNINLSRTETFKWTSEFLKHLTCYRKFALRMGNICEGSARYTLAEDKITKICRGMLKTEDLKESDFELRLQQKGVDMRIGLDIASLAYKKQVEQIILISGDSDFVPAAKLARREGIDFILDPMWADIRSDLHEHIDGLQSKWGNKKSKDKVQVAPTD